MENAPTDKYLKMGSCKFYQYVNDFLDYCGFLKDEYPCDAPTDYPLWEECEGCKHWKKKRNNKNGRKSRKGN